MSMIQVLQMQVDHLEHDITEYRKALADNVKQFHAIRKQINAMTVSFVHTPEDIGVHISKIHGLSTSGEVALLALQVQNATIQATLEIIENTLQ